MSNGTLPTVDLSCLPDSIPDPERAAHFALARELLQSRARERQELENGYAFRFDNDVLTSLATFVDNERRCCPFLSFEIVVAAAGGVIWLRITGPAGTREVLRAELDLPLSCEDRACGPGLAAGKSAVRGTDGRLLTWAAAGGIVAAFGVCAAGCLRSASSGAVAVAVMGGRHG